MIDVPPRGEGNGEPEGCEQHTSGPGGANRRWRICRNRLKIVDFFQISGWGRLLPAVFIL